MITQKAVANADDAPDGISYIDKGITNNPFPNFWAILLTIPFYKTDTYRVQICMSIAVSNRGKIGIRTKDNGTWYEWNVIS